MNSPFALVGLFGGLVAVSLLASYWMSRLGWPVSHRFVLELARHFLIAAILGFVGILPAAWITGPALLGPVLIPSALVGYGVSRSDFGDHPASARWSWVAALCWFGVVWSQVTVYDYRDFWSLFTDDYCLCVGQYFVTAPLLASASYSVAAWAGRSR